MYDPWTSAHVPTACALWLRFLVISSDDFRNKKVNGSSKTCSPLWFQYSFFWSIEKERMQTLQSTLLVHLFLFPYTGPVLVNTGPVYASSLWLFFCKILFAFIIPNIKSISFKSRLKGYRSIHHPNRQKKRFFNTPMQQTEALENVVSLWNYEWVTKM